MEGGEGKPKPNGNTKGILVNSWEKETGGGRIVGKKNLIGSKFRGFRRGDLVKAEKRGRKFWQINLKVSENEHVRKECQICEANGKSGREGPGGGERREMFCRDNKFKEFKGGEKSRGGEKNEPWFVWKTRGKKGRGPETRKTWAQTW